MFWKDGLSKYTTPEYDISFFIKKDDTASPRKYDLILCAENKRSFSKKYILV